MPKKHKFKISQKNASITSGVVLVFVLASIGVRLLFPFPCGQ